MESIKNILIIFVAIFLAYSCANDVLDTKPLDKYSEDVIWSDPNLAQGFVYDTQNEVLREYIKFPEDNNNFVGAEHEMHCDNQTASGGSTAITKDLLDKFYDAGWNAFSIIRQCNQIIEKVSANTNFTEKQKTELIAQGYFLRAMIYFDKAKFFGKYVIVNKVLSPDDELELPRTNTIKETYDFILSDLAEAAKGLPTTGPAGSITKGAALALKAEVALHGAAYIESGKDEYYQISKNASEDLFALGKYELDSDYGNMFNSHDGALNSPEIIFELLQHGDITTMNKTVMIRLVPNCSPTKTYDWVNPPLVKEYPGWMRVSPSVSLVDDYLVVDEDGEAKRWNETSYYNDWEANGGYVSDAIYKNRDLRFYASIVHDSSEYLGNLVTIRKGGNMHWSSNKTGGWGMTTSGYYQRKCVYVQDYGAGGIYTSHHFVILRLGRSYLNYAEVLLRLNKPKDALGYINKTRQIHGGLPELSTNLSIEDAWKWYKIERRVELYYEDDRFWSLYRWGKEDGDIVIPELNTNKQAFEISEDGTSFELVEIPNGYASRNEMKFSVRKYLFPVPEKERQLNDKLDQNPGW